MDEKLKVSVCSFNVLAPMWGPSCPDPTYAEYYQGMEHLLPLDERTPKLIRRIRHYEIICLQEVQQEFLDKLTKEPELASHQICFVPHLPSLWLPHDGSVHGNAVLVHRGILDPSVELKTVPMALSDDGNMAVLVVLQLRNGRKVTVISSHLECEGDYDAIVDTEEANLRAEQMKRLLALKEDKDLCPGLIVWGGDFNAPTSNPEFAHVFEAGFVDLTSDVISARTEWDDNMHLYHGPIDSILATGPDWTKLHVHAFKRPPLDAVEIKDKVKFLLDRHGSDHLPVGVSILI